MLSRLARAAVLGIALSAALASGCLRRRYDLCAESPPHPECPFDVGMPDAGSADAGPVDAPSVDAPSAAEDAPNDAAPEDASVDAP